jgi:transposase
MRQELGQICDNAGVILLYLPPYSPDFNPIEEAFSELKAWMKKNYLLAAMYPAYDGFIQRGLESLSGKPGNHFRSCHIWVDPENED